MADPTKLTRPPITEALVDIRIATDETITPERLQPLRDALLNQYPNVDEKRGFETQFRVEAGKLMPPSARELGFQGLWMTSTDGARIIQLRRDGFTFNNVGPDAYIGGDALLDEALTLWARYAAEIKAVGVIRLALRYINNLRLPLREGEDFAVYLTAAPDLPVPAPQRVSAFLSRVVGHDDNGSNRGGNAKIRHENGHASNRGHHRR